MVHGAHFHRPTCKHYKALEFAPENSQYAQDQDKKNDSCVECKRLGELCEAPEDFEEVEIRLPTKEEVEKAYVLWKEKESELYKIDIKIG